MGIKELLNFGLINIDKPEGPTSYSVSEFLRRRVKVSKTSHMGTLDPKVTGVLPITLGRACKLAAYFIKHDKSYVGILHTHKEQDIEKLQKLIDDNFMGKIKQTPPHRSAVKVQERERTVYVWRLLESSENKRDFLFECRVEGGTYIRKLCSDLGDMIGGAHMGELRRTSAGIFDESKIYKLDEFDRAVEEFSQGKEKSLRDMIMPAEDAIKQVLPEVQVDKSAIRALRNGKPLLKSNITKRPQIKESSSFAVFCGEDFIGTYMRSGDGSVFGKAEFVCS